jgi:hypothetical protein
MLDAGHYDLHHLRDPLHHLRDRADVIVVDVVGFGFVVGGSVSGVVFVKGAGGCGVGGGCRAGAGVRRRGVGVGAAAVGVEAAGAALGPGLELGWLFGPNRTARVCSRRGKGHLTCNEKWALFVT